MPTMSLRPFTAAVEDDAMRTAEAIKAIKANPDLMEPFAKAFSEELGYPLERPTKGRREK